MGPSDTSLRNPGRVQTIEQTSKKLKLGMALSIVVLGVGVIGLLVELPNSSAAGGEPSQAFPIWIALIVIGILMAALFRLLAWWHHG